MLDVRDKYFDWILDQVTTPEIKADYSRLFEILNETEFVWSNEFDANRAADGVELRGRFGEERGYSYYIWHESIDNRECSLLEMMAALAIRCEECIMGDDEYGDRTDIWFWNMVCTMGLKEENNDDMDVEYVRGRIKKVLNRDYAPDGYGGFFYVPGRNDMQKVEIWYQMNYWLNEFYN